MNKMALWIIVHAYDPTAEWAIIASNTLSQINVPSVFSSVIKTISFAMEYYVL